MPALIIVLGLGGLILILGAFAYQELSRPYPEERDAKRKSAIEAERLRRHAERDAILARAEILDQRTKAEMRRQYIREQYPPGTPVPEPELPDLPPDPREAMADMPADPSVRHRTRFPEEPRPEEPAAPDTRDLRSALRAGAASRDGDAGQEDRAPDIRSGLLRQALSDRTAAHDGIPDIEESEDRAVPDDGRAGLLKAGIAAGAGRKKKNRTTEPSEPGPSGDEAPEEVPAKKRGFGLGLRKARPDPVPEQEEAAMPEEDSADTAVPEDEPAKKRGFGLGRRKTGPDPVPDQEEAVMTEGESPDADPPEEKPAKKHGLPFGRKRRNAVEPEDDPTDGEGAGQADPDEPEDGVPEEPAKRGGLFGRKKARPETDDAGPAEKPKRRGLFGRKQAEEPEDFPEDDGSPAEPEEQEDDHPASASAFFGPSGDEAGDGIADDGEDPIPAEPEPGMLPEDDGEIPEEDPDGDLIPVEQEPEQLPDDGEEIPGDDPDGDLSPVEQEPEQLPDDGGEIPEEEPDDRLVPVEQEPEQLPNNDEEIPDDDPDGELIPVEQEPEPLPDDGGEIPTEDPDGDLIPVEQEPELLPDDGDEIPDEEPDGIPALPEDDGEDLSDRLPVMQEEGASVRRAAAEPEAPPPKKKFKLFGRR